MTRGYRLAFHDRRKPSNASFERAVSVPHPLSPRVGEMAGRPEGGIPSPKREIVH